jgi:Leucine-rich repeat (LRR) protein
MTFFLIRFEEVDADCHYNYDGQMTRNLKIRPNFTNHKTIKSANEVKNLVIFFGPSKHILTGIGEAFSNLEKLAVHDSSLITYERQNFANLTKLKRLDVQNKQIEFIAEDSFWDLPSLEGLSFFKNEIEELPKDIFLNLRKLKVLICGFNRISSLHKDLLKNNLDIEEIDFRNNLLKTIDVDFTKYTKLIELSFSSNDCIDKFWSKKRVYAYSVSSVEEVQKVIDVKCKGNLNSELKESWFRNEKA